MDPEGIRVLPGCRSAVPDARHSCNARFVESDSARAARARPFYASRADAYDAIITTPVHGWVTEVQRLRARGTVLDAGCGTGRYAHALTVAGFDVELLDASPALLGEARRRCPDLPAHQVDMCTVDLGRDFDIVACRGVLNDLVTEVDRSSAVRAASPGFRTARDSIPRPAGRHRTLRVRDAPLDRIATRGCAPICRPHRCRYRARDVPLRR
jgi:SAM-dependent methyltransferase